VDLLCTCRAGSESLLAQEWCGAGARELERGREWIRLHSPSGPAEVDSAFAHLILVEPSEVRLESVNAQARAVFDAFGESLRGENIQNEWPQAWLGPTEVSGLGRRIGATRDGFDALLEQKLARISRLARRALPAGIGSARGLFVWFSDFGRLWISRSAFVNGPRRMADDPSAPSRSYLKVEEAYSLVGCEPVAGETVADLGAAPGGWSYSAARRGARVVAVDNGPLKKGALGHPNIMHRHIDAFHFSPSPGEAFDWLFCDLVEEPHHVLDGLIRPWLQNRWCRKFIVNLKFGRADPLRLLAEARGADSPLALAGSVRIRQLFHDREEFTAAGSLRIC
jgi:23S rRNA (cytidine2498-2'-O)-methyltransferase